MSSLPFRINGVVGKALSALHVYLVAPFEIIAIKKGQDKANELLETHEAKDDVRFKELADGQRDHELKQGERHIAIMGRLGHIEGYLEAKKEPPRP